VRSAVADKRGHSGPPQSAPVDGRIRLYEIAWAGESSRYAADNQITTGQAVDFVGFVSKPTSDAGQVELSRFFVACCAADAVAYSVKVKPPAGTPKLADDTWVRVQGKLTGRPGYDLTVTATALDEVDQPSNPYC
jgi:putative membrane protein